MSACGKCYNRETKSKLSCSQCSKIFHVKCVNLTEEDLDLVKANNKVWCCEECSIVMAVNSPSSADLYKLVLSVKEELANLKKCSQESEKDLGKSLDLLHEKLDDNSKLIKQQSESLNACLMEIDKLKGENALLRNKLEESERQVDELSQYGRRNTLEIYGMPETANENTCELVKNIGRALDMEVKDEMIDACHRLKKPPHQPSGGIIVKFVRRIDKDLFLQRRKVKRNLNVSDLGMTGNEPIYVNQSLTPLRKLIFAEARKIRREKNYAFLWVDNMGNIKLKKHEGHKTIHVLNTIESVNKLI